MSTNPKQKVGARLGSSVGRLCKTPGCAHRSSVHEGLTTFDRRYRRCTMPDCPCRQYLTESVCSVEKCGAYLPNRQLRSGMCETHETEERDRRRLATYEAIEAARTGGRS